ncbi:MAG: hypothetical protein Q9167_008106, partial [Letrouitia subvulpina]
TPLYTASRLTDTPNDSRPGKSFLDDPRNQLHRVNDWLFKRLQADPGLISRFFKRPIPNRSEPESSNSKPLEVRQSAVNKYLSTSQQFLRQLGVLIYWSSGLPPRRKELAGVLWYNEETPRNLYILDGSVVFLGGYHKSQWRVGTRPVARFLAPAVGDLLVRYLIYIPPFIRFLHDCMHFPPPRGFLFGDQNGIWPPDRLGTQIKSISSRLLGFTITSRQWRHIAIALDRRLNAGRSCKLYGVSQQWDQQALHAPERSDSELDTNFDNPKLVDLDLDPLSRVRNFQASHTPSTNQTTYGNDITLLLGLTDQLLAAYRSVSQYWWYSVAGLDPPDSSVSSHKRTLSLQPKETLPSGKRFHPDHGSSLAIRRQIWNWRAIEQGLVSLFGPHAAPRNLFQRDGLLLVARSRPATIIVLPTGSGKSLLFLVPSQLPNAQVTVVIVPLIALRQDLCCRCDTWGIAYTIYNENLTPRQLHAVPSLLLVDIETAGKNHFLAFTRQLHAVGRLDRLVLDEAHLLLTAVHYRTELPAITTLRRLRCPFVCMTGTLPPSAESSIRELLHFTHPEVLRASSDRPNLRYCIELSAPPPSSELSREEHLIERATEICFGDIQKWATTDQGDSTRPASAYSERGICFVRQTRTGEQLAYRLSARFYHGKLSSQERADCVTAWSQGASSPFIVATSALSAGVHYPSVRRVIHIDAPDGLLNYGQETGRAGRDRLHASCLILLAPKWAVSWDNRYINDFLTEDRLQMTRLDDSPAVPALRLRPQRPGQVWLKKKIFIRLLRALPPR